MEEKLYKLEEMINELKAWLIKKETNDEEFSPAETKVMLKLYELGEAIDDYKDKGLLNYENYTKFVFTGKV